MECACIDLDVDDYCLLLSSNKPRARKEHKCYECGKIIYPGCLYLVENTLFESNFTSYKTCLDCLSIRDVFFCNYYYGQIWEKLSERIWDGGIDDCFGKDVLKLTLKAKEKVLKLMNEVQRDREE